MLRRSPPIIAVEDNPPWRSSSRATLDGRIQLGRCEGNSLEELRWRQGAAPLEVRSAERI